MFDIAVRFLALACALACVVPPATAADFGPADLTLGEETKGVRTFAWSPDGLRVFVIGDGATGIVDATRKTLLELPRRDVSIAPTFCALGKCVVVHYRDSTAQLLDATTGAVIVGFAGPLDESAAPQFSLDDRRVLLSYKDRTARIHEIANPSRAVMLPAKGDRHAVRLFADNDHLLKDIVATVDIEARTQPLKQDGQEAFLRLWDSITGVMTHELPVNARAGAQIATLSPFLLALSHATSPNVVTIRSSSDGREIMRLPGAEETSGFLEFTPDELQLVMTARNKVLVWQMEHTPVVRDPAKWSLLKEFVASENDLDVRVGFGPDRSVALVYSKSRVALYALPDWRMIAEMSTARQETLFAQISPSGEAIAVSTRERPLQVWSIARVAKLKGFGPR